jgi:hypothetical protein
MATQFRHPLALDGAALLEARVRRPVALQAQAKRSDGSVMSAVVTDLSFEGCALQSGSALEAGEAVQLTVQNRGAIEAIVRWVSGTKAGLLFRPDAESATGPLKAERCEQRISLEAEVALRRAGKLTFRVRLFDVSPAGCKAEFVERPELHEQLWVKFDRVEALEASVCWIAGTKVGLRFLRPVHPAVFDLLLQRLS